MRNQLRNIYRTRIEGEGFVGGVPRGAVSHRQQKSYKYGESRYSLRPGVVDVSRNT